MASPDEGNNKESAVKSLLIFPNQLLDSHPGLDAIPDQVILIEDSLFFGDWRYPMSFHKQKLWLHRASMKRMQSRLESRGVPTLYVDYDSIPHSLETQLASSLNKNTTCLLSLDPVDDVLKKRLISAAKKLQLSLELMSHPGFLNDSLENREYRAGKKRWLMADFYKWQRKRLNVLMEGDQPVGGKWSFDADNRKKIPKKTLDQIPRLPMASHDEIDKQAQAYVERHFPDNPGSLQALIYPTCSTAAEAWLDEFLRQRLERFGDFEDAIVEGESWLWHSVLTPMLNTGLLTPQQVLQQTLKYANEHQVPLNSLEGFIRQIIGWREFIRGTYEDLSVPMRTTNYWRHHQKLPSSFYDGSTGIAPIDDAIKRILASGYCHHIERLMVLGGFMFLCEIDPDEIYRWFMEMFVDSYDWVMVPNVYAMSQNADGGLITTKPYFSGSAYIRKMSHYPKGPWCDIWDGLYWRWIGQHSKDLEKNPRWAMMCSMAKKMSPEKKQQHVHVATRFLNSLQR
jgi:deoxyribodipyrimidine photolyase-related protein